MPRQSLLEFETLLKTARQVTQLDTALEHYLKSWGISSFSFSYFAAQKFKGKLRHEVVSKRLKHWHAYYHEENFDPLDATASLCRKSLTPLFWDTRLQLQNARTAKDRHMRQESIDLGVEKGLSIPLHAPQGQYAELTLRQFKGEHCLEAWTDHKFEWQMAALYYFHALLKSLDPALMPPAFKFTKREQDCLHLMMQHYSLAELSQALGMSQRTVNFHIQNINRKLGTRNKYQSVSKILHLLALS